VVTDKAGKHIHGLSKNDFRILENGKEQPIAVFEEVTATSTRLRAPENPPNAFSNLSVSTPDRHAVTIIVLDEINTPFLDQNYGRTQLIKYLAASLDSQQTVALMVLGSKGLRRVANFTDDPSVLINALKKVGSELPAMYGSFGEDPNLADTRSSLFGGQAPLPSQGEAESRLREFLAGEALANRFRQDRAIEDTLQAFLSISWSISGVPGRKSLIWATGSFPFYLDSPSAKPPDPHVSALYERAMEALNDAQISVYPLDVRGLVSNALPSDVTYAGSSTRPYPFANGTQQRSERLSSTIANMETFAGMTGGRAFYSSNDLTEGFRRAAEDSASYYLLGYYLNSRSAKPGWRKLRVRLEGRHDEVRAREGFFVGSTAINAESARQADVNFALGSPFESTGIPMLVRWNPAVPKTEASGKRAEFAIVVPANSVVNDSDQQFDIDFVWETSRDAVPAQRDGKSTKGTVDAESLARIKRDGVVYRSFLQLPPGDYKVHFVVRNNLNGRIGSVTAPLTVN
jgi:VWFA-related protein